MSQEETFPISYLCHQAPLRVCRQQPFVHLHGISVDAEGGRRQREQGGASGCRLGQVSGRGEEGCRRKRRNRGRREGEREERRVGRKMKEGVSVWGGFEEDPYAKGATGQTAQWAELWLKGDWSILAFPSITRAGSVQRGGRDVQRICWTRVLFPCGGCFLHWSLNCIREGYLVLKANLACSGC